jgi:hypothetical protein
MATGDCPVGTSNYGTGAPTCLMRLAARQSASEAVGALSPSRGPVCAPERASARERPSVILGHPGVRTPGWARPCCTVTLDHVGTPGARGRAQDARRCVSPPRVREPAIPTLNCASQQMSGGPDRVARESLSERPRRCTRTEPRVAPRSGNSFSTPLRSGAASRIMEGKSVGGWVGRTGAPTGAHDREKEHERS